MNYEAHYNTLIERAKNRLLECYTERHHVVPKCMDGSDDAENLVDLTASEHFIAHQLLVKINPGHRGLAYAAMMMGAKNNKSYRWLREANAKTQAALMKGNKHSVGKTPWNKGKTGLQVAWNKGKTMPDSMKRKATTLSEEHKRNIGLAQKGTTRKPRSEETKRKIAESVRKRHAEGRYATV